MSTQTTDLTAYAVDLAKNARQAGYLMAQTTGQARDAALRLAAQHLRQLSSRILEANAKDMAAGEKAGLSKAVLDRLKLDEKRIAGIAADVEAVAGQVDPVGQIIDGWVRPNGLRIEKVRVPIGSVLIIYEARPNVTSDAAALCIKSGNACILRGGKESLHSNMAIGQVFRDAVAEAHLPVDGRAGHRDHRPQPRADPAQAERVHRPGRAARRREPDPRRRGRLDHPRHQALCRQLSRLRRRRHGRDRRQGP